MSGIIRQQHRRLAACWGVGPALGRGAHCGSGSGEDGQLPSRWGEDRRAVMMCSRECPPAMARPACCVCVLWGVQHLEEGALLMLLPQGGRADNGWWKGDELCHQTRGLKDGPLERYQSCLDQDVRLSRSSVFSPLLFLLLPLPLALGSPSSLSLDPTLLLLSLCASSCLRIPPFYSLISFVLPFPLSLSPSLSSSLLSCIPLTRGACLSVSWPRAWCG